MSDNCNKMPSAAADIRGSERAINYVLERSRTLDKGDEYEVGVDVISAPAVARVYVRDSSGTNRIGDVDKFAALNQRVSAAKRDADGIAQLLASRGYKVRRA